MLTFWINLTIARIDSGMSRKEAISKVLIKWRDEVERALENDSDSI